MESFVQQVGESIEIPARCTVEGLTNQAHLVVELIDGTVVFECRSCRTVTTLPEGDGRA